MEKGRGRGLLGQSLSWACRVGAVRLLAPRPSRLMRACLAVVNLGEELVEGYYYRF